MRKDIFHINILKMSFLLVIDNNFALSLLIENNNLIMPTSIKLSKITKVDLRSCWQNEASDFTPWLASEENIALLADALGMNELANG